MAKKIKADATGTEAAAVVKGPTKKVRLVTFLKGLVDENSDASPVAQSILDYMASIGFFKTKRVKVTLPAEVETWAKITFISEAGDLEGLSDTLVEAIADAAAKKGVEDPTTTKVYKIAAKLGASAVGELYEAWVIQQYKRVMSSKK